MWPVLLKIQIPGLNILTIIFIYRWQGTDLLIDTGRRQRTISEVWKIYLLNAEDRVCQIKKIRGSAGSKDFFYLANSVWSMKQVYFSNWGYCTWSQACIFYTSRFIKPWWLVGFLFTFLFIPNFLVFQKMVAQIMQKKQKIFVSLSPDHIYLRDRPLINSLFGRTSAGMRGDTIYMEKSPLAREETFFIWKKVRELLKKFRSMDLGKNML